MGRSFENAHQRSKEFRTMRNHASAHAGNALSDADAARSEDSAPDMAAGSGLSNKNNKSNGDAGFTRGGHQLTYIGIFIFTILVYFRPYELLSSFAGSASSIASTVAIITLLIYLPSQLAAEGRLSVWTTEIKCVLFIFLWALLTIPIAKDPALAWNTFTELFSKVLLIIVVLAIVLRTKQRLYGLIWLSLGVGVMLSYQAVGLYQLGVFKSEGYRVSIDVGGMFDNANDLALHLVMFTPVAIALGFAARNMLARLVYFVSAGLMIVGNLLTQSRGGFLGLIAVTGILVWKLGRKNRLKAILAVGVVTVAIMAFAPGNYGLRVMSIFVPSLDVAGSSGIRRELLDRSILVTARNPWGIGIGNFPLVGMRNLQTHNAYTQVSSEVGVLALAAYLVLLISPMRRLYKIENSMAASDDHSWMYYVNIGIQASIAGYMFTSFFASVAYLWYIYYPIAYAICLRRLYEIEHSDSTD